MIETPKLHRLASSWQHGMSWQMPIEIRGAGRVLEQASSAGASHSFQTVHLASGGLTKKGPASVNRFGTPCCPGRRTHLHFQTRTSVSLQAAQPPPSPQGQGPRPKARFLSDLALSLPHPFPPPTTSPQDRGAITTRVGNRVSSSETIARRSCRHAVSRFFTTRGPEGGGDWGARVGTPSPGPVARENG